MVPYWVCLEVAMVPDQVHISCSFASPPSAACPNPDLPSLALSSSAHSCPTLPSPAQTVPALLLLLTHPHVRHILLQHILHKIPSLSSFNMFHTMSFTMLSIMFFGMFFILLVMVVHHVHYHVFNHILHHVIHHRLLIPRLMTWVT